MAKSEMEREYGRCLEREKDRLRSWSRTRQGRFEVYGVLHYEEVAKGSLFREHRTSWLSDGGKNAATVRGCEDDIRDSSPEQRVNRARMAVSRMLPHCKTVFRLVLKNGTNRKESVGQLMKMRRNTTWKAAERRYRRQLWQLIGLLESPRGMGWSKLSASRVSS